MTSHSSDHPRRRRQIGEPTKLFGIKIGESEKKTLAQKAAAWGLSLGSYLVDSGMRRRLPKKSRDRPK